ncbi:MAG: four helix bundle protein [Patescibacteria group bacterium]|jgi:four helix bundle protein
MRGFFKGLGRVLKGLKGFRRVIELNFFNINIPKPFPTLQDTSKHDMKYPYENLLVWQKADDLLENIYTATFFFPKEEQYNVTSQLRRAALSVVLNIVEGHSRGTKQDFKRFLVIARASLTETIFLISFSYRQKYIDEDKFKKLELKAKNTSFFLNQLIRSI